MLGAYPRRGSLADAEGAMRSNLLLLFVTVLLLFLPASVRAQGRVYYVGPDGSDNNPGTRDGPWASPGFASRQLRPGDTLIILGGRYILSRFDEDIITPPSGTTQGWTAIQGQRGDRPVLAGRDNLLMAIDLSGVSYVRVENLEITHDDQASGRAAHFRDAIEGVYAPSSHLVLKGLYVHHIDEFGLNFRDVADLEVVNCRIEYCGFGAIGGPAALSGGWRNVHIDGCRLSYSGHYYQGGDGSNRPYDRPDGFGIEPSSGPIHIVDTTAEHNYGDGLDSKAAHTTIRRCVVANNSCDGIKLWGHGSRVENTLIYGRGDGDPTITPWAPIVIHTTLSGAQFDLVNVTVDDALGRNYLMYAQYDHPNVPVDLTIRNCIFRGIGRNSPIYVGRASTLAVGHSLFYLPNSDTILVHGGSSYTADSISTLGQDNRYGDPLFVAPAWGARGDYHLGESSPAIDAGTRSDAPTDDLDGRPRDNWPDLGAYEHRQTSVSRRLRSGWNLVSLPIVPGRSEVADVLQTIEGRYDVAMGHDAARDEWLWYDPAMPPECCTLSTLDERTAFWILVREPVTLTVYGASPGSTDQQLRRGWNLVSYPATQSREVTEALSSISGYYTTVFEYEASWSTPWRRFSMEMPSWGNTLTRLAPGYGYWVHVIDDCRLRIVN